MVDPRRADAPTTASLEWDGAPSDLQPLGPAFHARTYLIDSAMRRLQPRRLLDIGCGRGYVTAIAARHAGSVVAADLARGAAVSTRAALAAHPQADVIVANVLEPAWAETCRSRSRTFDTVLLSEVLEHLDDDLAALQACRELIAEGGSLVLTVPAGPSLWTEWDDLAGHRRRYTKVELTAKLTVAGFRVREVVSWGFPLTGWLAIRGARMRARRAASHEVDGEVPGLIARILPVAAPLLKLAARVERWLSFLDRGAGYVVVAERLPSDQLLGRKVDVAA